MDRVITGSIASMCWGQGGKQWVGRHSGEGEGPGTRARSTRQQNMAYPDFPFTHL